MGAAIVPTAPLLVEGVSARVPEGVDTVRDVLTATLARLPPADIVILLAFGARAVHDVPGADLGGVGRPDVSAKASVHASTLSAVARAVQYPRVHGGELPLGLAVLTLLVGTDTPVLPVAVPRGASFDALVAVGAGLVRAMASEDLGAVVVAAGDCSAGLGERSPLFAVPGARQWDEQAIAAVASGRLDRLRPLGPDEARRVGALGWAPMTVLHGACARAKLGMVLRHYSAPRGVGYLIAQGQ